MADTELNATELVAEGVAGVKGATDRLAMLLYGELRALAGRYLQGERRDHTLQPTALVHEAYLRLVRHDRIDWKGRTHFFAVAATIMRRILVDHARSRRASKRGGPTEHITLDEGHAPDVDSTFELLALNEALLQLAKRGPRQVKVAELRLFGGLKVGEIAETLKVSERTVKDDWRSARAWLTHALRPGAPAPGG